MIRKISFHLSALLLIVTLLLYVTEDASAQRQRYIYWNPDTALLQKKTFDFSSVQFEDRRSSKEKIGYLRAGAFNEYVEVVTAYPLSTMLQAYIEPHIKGRPQKDLLVVLHDFAVAEPRGEEQVGTVHIQADLFTGQSGRYVLCRNYDTLYEVVSRNPTKQLQQAASLAIVHMVSVAMDCSTSQGAQLYSYKEAVLLYERTLRAYPAYAAETLVKGAYRTIEAFLQQQPTDTLIKTIRVRNENMPTRHFFYHRKENGKRGERFLPQEYFAVYDGEALYVSIDGEFRPAKKDGYDFYATKFAQGLIKDDPAAGLGAMFGAVGGAIGSAIKPKGKLRNIPYKLRFVPASGQWIRTARRE